MRWTATWSLGALLVLIAPRLHGEEAARDELTATQEKMARLYEQKDDLQSALKIWRELLASSSERPSYLYEVSRLELELGKAREALAPARKLVRLHPQNPRYRGQLVAVLAALNLSGETLPHLEFLRKQAPNRIEVRKELADAYQALKRPAQALEQIDWLLQRFPGNLEYRRARADLLGELNRDGERQAELRRLLPRLPAREAAAIYREQAENHMADDRFVEAERELRSALAVYPADAKARALLQRMQRWQVERRRRQEQSRRDAEQYQNWLQDVQEHGEDF